ncbi:MAG TPA: Bax inhibitor-1 family protein, partial [Steroidobacteraceae bacterium]|nr:Bax inhibitor-1 family protein [Steroidobacteraceae bacterium]
MNELRTTLTATQSSVIATNKVLRNTYLLLGTTLAFSAMTAYLAYAAEMRPMNPLLMLVGYFALLFGTMKTRESAWGLLFVFLLTGFLGLTLGPIVSLYVKFL